MSVLASESPEPSRHQDGLVAWRALDVLFARSPVAVVVTDDDGVCVRANPAAEQLFGVHPLGGRHVRDLGGPALDFDRVWRAFRARGSHRGEFIVRRPDGCLRVAAYSATPDVVPGLHLTVLHDVTGEWRKTRRRLVRMLTAESRGRRAEEARATLERASRARERGLAVFSHELRNAATIVLGSVRLLQRGLLTADQQERALRAIEHSTELEMRLVDDLLDIARIATGTLAVDLAPADVLRVVRDAVDTARPTAEAKGVELGLQAPPERFPALADAVRLRQAFLNVLSNAVKFTPGGGRITVEVRSGAGSVVVTVTDSGCGVPPALLPRVFEPFIRADEDADRRSGGLGLGLTIVRHIVDAHRGTVRASSGGAGRGATFEIVLPSPG
jgi:PAS domain S-box-containing protein